MRTVITIITTVTRATAVPPIMAIVSVSKVAAAIILLPSGLTAGNKFGTDEIKTTGC